MHMTCRGQVLTLSLGVVLTVPSISLGQATAPDDQQSAYRSSIAQEAVRKQTQKIQDEIAQLLSELKLNGLGDADLALLTKTSNHLSALSTEDMQKVINALQSASMSTDGSQRQKALVNAFQGQKDVALKLKSLAAELAAQESQKAIPSKLQNLIARQSANIRQTKSFQASNHAVAQMTPQEISQHDVASSEQANIGGEIDILFKIVAAAPAPAAATPDSAPDISKLVLDAMNASPLKDNAAQATQLTKDGPFFSEAVDKQIAVRDNLTAILRTARSNMDAVSRLQEVKAQLNELINDQHDLADVTQQSKLDGSTLAERQSKINDRTSVTLALLKPISQTAAEQVSGAQKDMDQSSSALVKAKNSADAAPQVQTVAKDLEKAESLLEEQIAAAQKQQGASPTDKLAQLQQLQAQIDQAQKDPQLNTAALQKLQQDASTLSPQAASKIADAGDKLQQAQPDMPAADKLLADASAAVQQQENALAQAAQQYQAMQQATDQLNKAEQQAQAATQAMQQNTSTMTEAAKDLTQAQQAAAQLAQNQALPPDAQQAMQQAAQDLNNAANQAVQGQKANAEAQNQKAMAAMQQAQAGLAQAMAQAQGQGQGQGQPPQPGQPQQTQPGQAMASEAPEQGGALLGGMGVGGVGQVMGGLKPKDRDAITQYQAEKSPPEYAPLIQQYLKNLADSSSSDVH